MKELSYLHRCANRSHQRSRSRAGSSSDRKPFALSQTGRISGNACVTWAQERRRAAVLGAAPHVHGEGALHSQCAQLALLVRHSPPTNASRSHVTPAAPQPAPTEHTKGTFTETHLDSHSSCFARFHLRCLAAEVWDGVRAQEHRRARARARAVSGREQTRALGSLSALLYELTHTWWFTGIKLFKRLFFLDRRDEKGCSEGQEQPF